MGRIISVCNQKGGVGKTTTTINLAAALALDGKKILLLDLDPQANATGGLGLDKKKIELSTYQILLQEVPAENAILPTPVKNLFILPSHIALSGAEVELVALANRGTRLKKILQPLRSEYDAILIDSPPSLGLLTLNALSASDSVLIPLQCEYYALEGLSQLLETIQLVRESLNPNLAVEGVLLTMADFRTKLTTDVIEEAKRFFGSKVFDAIVPRSVRLSEAPSRGLPIALYDPHSTGAKAYRQLADKIKENLHAGDTRLGTRDTGIDTGGESPQSGGSDQDSPGVDPVQPVPAQEEPA